MKVKIVRRSEDEVANCDWQNAIEIYVDGKEVFSAFDGEPEDGNLSRNFNDIYKIPELLEMAFKAGKNSEVFELDKCVSDDI